MSVYVKRRAEAGLHRARKCKQSNPDDLHTHLLSSKSTRSPRQVQLTLPYGVSRQRSPQPPFMCLHGDS